MATKNPVVTSAVVVEFVRDRFTWLAYLMLGYFAYMQAVLGPLMPFLRADLNLSYTVAGLHLSAFAVGMVLAGFTSDFFARRFGRYVVFWGGAAGMAASGLGLTFGRHVAFSMTTIFFMGWLGTWLLVMIQATLSDRHGQRRTVALTESNVIASICASLAPVMVGLFQRAGVGWQGALFFGALALVLMVVSFRSVLLPPPQPMSQASGASTQRLPGAFWGYWLVVFLAVSIEWCIIFWGADFLETSVGLSRVNAATMMSVFFAAMIVGRFVGSRLSRSLPGDKLLLVALALTTIGFPLFWLAPLAAVNLLGLFVAGLGVANLFPLTLSLAVSVASPQTDAASARMSLAAGLAILLAPFALGAVADGFGIHSAYGLVLVFLALAALVTVAANRVAAAK